MADFDPSSKTPTEGKGPFSSRRWRNRVLKWVRRAHLYTGLILLPWVIFFGFSGMLFNHPEFGETEEIASWSGAELASKGFQTIDGEALAAEIVADLNRGGKGAELRLIPGKPVKWEGGIVFQGQAKGGAFTLSIDPSEGSAVLHQTPESPKAKVPPFLFAEVVPKGGVKVEQVEEAAGALLAASGLETVGKPEASTRGGAELRFQIESPGTGQRWNVSWNLLKGGLAARELSLGDGPDLYTVLTRLHKTHHYPHQFGARWLWNAFGDATGLTMVFWGLSGAIMWWQIKPTRLIGVAGLSVAAVLAFYIFAGTYSNLHWVPREARPAQSSSKGSPRIPTDDATSVPKRAGNPAMP